MAAEALVTTLKANPISVVCGALALTLAVGIYLRSDRVPETEALLEQKASLGERIDANLKNGVQLADQYAAVSASRKEIETRLIRADEIAKNAQFFYKLEEETRVKLVDMRQVTAGTSRGGKSKNFYRGISYAVSVRADYTRVLDFLQRLESNQRFCRIYGATISVGSGSPSERAGELTLTLSLELLGQP